MKLFAAVAFLCAPIVSGFLGGPGAVQQSTAIHMSPQEGMKKAAASFVAVAFLVGNLGAAEPAFAVDNTLDFGSSQVLAGRSGGRAGGRSTAARAPSRAAPSSSSTTHVIHRTTYVQPSPVIVAPPVYGYGYGYNPVPGLGTKNEDCSALDSLFDTYFRLNQL